MKFNFHSNEFRNFFLKNQTIGVSIHTYYLLTNEVQLYVDQKKRSSTVSKKKKKLKFNIVPVKIHKHVLNNIKMMLLVDPDENH